MRITITLHLVMIYFYWRKLKVHIRKGSFFKINSKHGRNPCPTSWTELIKQRLRWAGKMRHVKDWNLKWIPALIWIQRILLLSFFIFSLVLASVNYILAAITAIMLQLLLDFYCNTMRVAL